MENKNYNEIWSNIRDRFNKNNDKKLRKSSEDGSNFIIDLIDNGKAIKQFKMDLSKSDEDIIKNIKNQTGVELQNPGEKTNSIEGRRNAIKKLLKGKKYEDYIEILNELVKDKKNQSLLDEAFGGDLSDTELEVSDANIPVTRLNPTQNEIDLDKSLKYGLSVPGNLKKYFENPVVIKMPLITYNDNFIIDGHHRWSQVYCFNPKARMACINFEGDLSAMQMLKATQGSIAAEINQVPVQKVEGTNMFDVSEADLKKYISTNLSDEVIKDFPNYVPSLTDKDKIVDYITANCMKLKSNNTPITNAPKRDVMPQTDKAPQALNRLEKGTMAMSRKFSINRHFCKEERSFARGKVNPEDLAKIKDDVSNVTGLAKKCFMDVTTASARSFYDDNKSSVILSSNKYSIGSGFKSRQITREKAIKLILDHKSELEDLGYEVEEVGGSNLSGNTIIISMDKNPIENKPTPKDGPTGYWSVAVGDGSRRNPQYIAYGVTYMDEGKKLPNIKAIAKRLGETKYTMWYVADNPKYYSSYNSLASYIKKETGKTIASQKDVDNCYFEGTHYVISY